MREDSLILLTGATGYIGGRLLRALLRQGRRVRCLARRPKHLRVDADAEVVQGDVLRPETLAPALNGIDIAYYMVHSMSSDPGFEERDVQAARNFAAAAKSAGVKRIVYLGGLGSDGEGLSPHLKSRQQTGDALREAGVPVVEFRASIVIGSGSLSFEIIRSLVERLPVMIAPRWVRTPAQPIAIEDVVAYLAAAIDLPEGREGVFEIGGADVVSYGEIMREYARQRALQRFIIPVPVLTPHLSSLWLTLVTPAHAAVGRLLIEGVRNPTSVRTPGADAVFGVQPKSVGEAIARALSNEDAEFAETRWSDALSSSRAPQSWGGARFGSRIVDSRTVRVDVPPARAFRPVRRIGGTAGWYYGNRLWRLRGLMDSFLGGVGLRRGRKNPATVAVGDTLDFWRVEAFEPDRRLRLMAEMKLPGRAWLEFEVTPDGEGSTVRQTAIFDPLGLAGLAYWYALYPVHRFIFRGMLDGIAARARTP